MEEAWRTYIFTQAHFGDLSAGLLHEVAKKKAADLGEQIDQVVAEQIQKHVYVHDLSQEEEEPEMQPPHPAVRNDNKLSKDIGTSAAWPLECFNTCKCVGFLLGQVNCDSSGAFTTPHLI